MKLLQLTAGCILTMAMILCVPVPVMAEGSSGKSDKMRLAVMDLVPKGVSKDVAVTVSDLLRSDIVDTGRFVVVERGQMNQIFKEQELQMAGCTDNSCAVEIGKLLSANKMILGEVNKLDSMIIITVRIVDVSKGVAEFSTNEKAESTKDIDKAVKKLVENLTLRITGKKPVAEYERPSGYYLRGFVPGWAQIYTGNSLKGWGFAGISLAAAGFACYSYYDFSAKKKKYDDLGQSATAGEFTSKYNAKKDAAKLANIGFYTFVGIYVINWFDVVFFNKNMPDDTALLNNLPEYYLTISPLTDSFNQNEKSMSLGLGMRF